MGGLLLMLRGGCGRFIVNTKGRLWEVLSIISKQDVRGLSLTSKGR